MGKYADFHRRSIADRDGFWSEQAALVHWQKPFGQVCDFSRPPFARIGASKTISTGNLT